MLPEILLCREPEMKKERFLVKGMSVVLSDVAAGTVILAFEVEDIPHIRAAAVRDIARDLAVPRA